MQREILFRRVYNNEGHIQFREWGVVYEDGRPSGFNNPPYLSGYSFVSDDEFTGLFDKNGTRIFENDRCGFFRFNYEYKVVFENGKFVLYHTDPDLDRWGDLSRAFDADIIDSFKDGLEVTGNIHDTPE